MKNSINQAEKQAIKLKHLDVPEYLLAKPACFDQPEEKNGYYQQALF